MQGFLTFCYENPISTLSLHFHNKFQNFVSLRQKERKETFEECNHSVRLIRFAVVNFIKQRRRFRFRPRRRFFA